MEVKDQRERHRQREKERARQRERERERREREKDRTWEIAAEILEGKSLDVLKGMVEI